MKIVVEWNTVGGIGQPAQLRIVRYEHSGPLYLQIATAKAFSEAKLPENFFERCRVHNVCGGGDFIL